MNSIFQDIRLWSGPRQLWVPVGYTRGDYDRSSNSFIGFARLNGGAGRGFVVEGRPDPGAGDRPGADYSVACPNYFRAMGVRIIKGREFTDQDTVESPGVIVIDEAMAHKFWPGEDPSGRVIDLGGPGGPRLTVVGVVADMRHRQLDEEMHPQFFSPYPQVAWPWMNIVLRTNGLPESYTVAIKKALAEVEPDRPVSDVQTMENIVQDSLGPRRFPTILLSAFALLALLLSTVGIIAVVSYSVAQRTQEIGIRMALGARPRDVLRLMLHASMTWVFVGIAIGLAGSLALTRLLGTLLYNVKPTDPEVIGTVALLLTSVAFLACYIPARRAAKVDPMVALRYE
jgi:putative ABC transport system permease protein